MELFLQALINKVRFSTPKGLLDTERLIDLNIPDLKTLVTSLYVEEDSQHDVLKELFSEDIPVVTDPIPKLMFDVACAVLKMKLTAQKEKRDAMETKKHNERIDSIIARKKDEELEGKTIAELELLRHK